MKISLNWLKDYIDLPKNITPQKLTEDLTMSTVEVESVTNPAEEFENIIVGKILEIKKHSNADKLKIVMADIGEIKKLKAPLSSRSTAGWLPETTRKGEIKGNINDLNNNIVQIVCGGTNLKENMLVAVALPGARVKWHGQSEPVILEETKIRGEKSFGMICSSNEIGLQDLLPCGSMEITDLSGILNDKNIGQQLAQALKLDDVIIEIENKSLTNRPDLWSHYGIARELSVIYKILLKKPEIFEKFQNTTCPSVRRVSNFQINSKSQIQNSKLNINIEDKNLCSRYIGCIMQNIKIASSPEWMQKRLEAVGLRAIDNIVDITNYVLLDIGEPTHAFDLALLNQKQFPNNKINIIVRKSKRDEIIQSLDGEDRKLDKDMLVIADTKKPIAIAGIMGGANSEVTDKTTEIILEAATFNAMNIRKTSQKLNLRTEASVRFEKNLDSNLAEIAMLRMLYLIKKNIPEAEIIEYIDNYPVKPENINIEIKHNFIEKRIGQSFSKKEVIDILTRLGFEIDEKNKIYKIKVPSWRATGDISIPEDIIEEVARIYGYDNLKEKVEKVEMNKAKFQLEFDLENKIKNYLSLGCGMNEVFNYPWLDEKILNKFNLSDKNYIEIDNPPAEENRFLQISLIPNLIKNAQDNLRYFSKFKLFELARVFKPGQDKSFGDDVLPEQPKMLAGIIVSKDDVFFEIKGIIEKFSIFNFQFSNNFQLNNLQFLNKEKFLGIFLDDREIGWLGEMQDKIKNKNIGLFEINFSKLCRNDALHCSMLKYQQIPQFPLIERDIAIEVDWDVKWGDVSSAVSKAMADENVIKNIIFLSEFDLSEKKSLAFKVIYQADRTLKDEDVKIIENKIIKLLKKKFNAELRK